MIPVSSAADLATVPTELVTKIQMMFYNDPSDDVFKSVGVN
ncbi:hypothetical protein [Marinitoga arctica]